jgi:eukaryotic-like serine/threonine-protein kinase
MTLSAGTRLGPYDILAPIGAGGMGEVYRAKDPRLGRYVAIKVLPASFSSDPDRLKRFEQEARAAGVLNHPNITIVYDIGSHEGAPYVVQELLEGETLRAELAGGRFSPRKAAEYAVQIAQGLAAAHEKGIVHRDLKPENLFVTNEGRVKILDFGLAKLTQPEGSVAVTSLPTATEPGVVMGTIGYMSPEQIKAKPADARSDIFALGAILYEMLSGQRAFRGDSAGETMAAILKEDPPDLSVTNRNISPGLERIVRHCLEKNPERRFQSASDVAFDLEAVSGVSGSVIPRSSEATRPRRILRWVGTLAAFLALAAVAAFIALRLGGASPPSFQQLTFRRGRIFNARFAPDGQTVVFWASWDVGWGRIYSLRPGSPEWSPLNLPDLGLLSVSRSGELAVAILPVEGKPSDRDGALARVSLSGGSPRDVLTDVDDADWAPEGSNLAVAHRVGGRARLEYPIGKVLYEPSNRIESPRVSPRGDRVAFADHPVLGETFGSVMVADRSGSTRDLSKPWFDLGTVVWSPGGNEVWFSASRTGLRDNIWAVSLSGRLRLLAETPGSNQILDVSPTGRVLLRHQSLRAFISGIPPGETAERDLSWLDFSWPLDISDDGKTLLFQEWGEGGGTKGAVYLRRMDGSPPVRLGEGFALSLSPDGRLVLARLYTHPPRLVLLPTGVGEAKPLSTGPILVHSAAWFPDGKRILVSASAPGKPVSYYALDAGGGEPRIIASAENDFGGDVFRGTISPDGRFLARVSKERHLYLLPLGGGQRREVAGAEPDELPVRWSGDGRFLFVVKRKGTREIISRLDPVSGRREPWKEFTISADAVGLRADEISILLSSDGNALFWGYQRYSDELYLVDGLK